jgi:hypothetical protein
VLWSRCRGVGIIASRRELLGIGVDRSKALRREEKTDENEKKSQKEEENETRKKSNTG